MKIIRNNMEIELTDRELEVAYNEWNRRICREDVIRYIKKWGEDNGVNVEKYIADYGLIEEITDDYQNRLESNREYDRDDIELYEAAYGNLDFEEE